MNAKRILGCITLVGAIALYSGSVYITNRVDAGKSQIASAQKKVDQSQGLFSLSPITKDIGDGLTGQAQKKLNAANMEVSDYEKLAHSLKIGSIVLFVLGCGIIFLSRKK